MVRVLAVSDEVVESLCSPAVSELDPRIVLATGDLPWDYLEFLSSALDVPVVFVPGNHDPAVENSRQSRRGVFVRDGLVVDAPRPLGAVNADLTIVEAAGLRIAGLGGCVRYRPGPNQYTQKQFDRRARTLARRARKAGGQIDVLITHAPPLGLGDGEDTAHEGIAALHGLLMEIAPAWHLHGHIHPYGQPQHDRELGTTTIRNVVPWALLDIEPSLRSSESCRGA